MVDLSLDRGGSGSSVWSLVLEPRLTGRDNVHRLWHHQARASVLRRSRGLKSQLGHLRDLDSRSKTLLGNYEE